MSLTIDKIQLDIIINNDQSRKRLRELNDEAAGIKREMKNLVAGTKEYIDASERLKAVQTRIEGVKREIGITGMSLKELTAHQKELNMVLNNMNPKLPGYQTLQKELKETTNRIKELKGQAGNTGSSLGKLADGFNKYFLVVSSVVAAITGIAFSFKKAVDAFNEFEKKVSQLSSLTGLTGDGLKYVSDKAKELSTSVTDEGVKITKSAGDIVDGFSKMGSAMPQLLKDKQALTEVTKDALTLAEAGKMEATPAIEATAAALNQFNLRASESSRVINVLAAGSLEGSAEISDLAGSMKNVGTVAADSNLSLENTVAWLEVLGEKQLKGEEAGTKLRGALLKMKDAGVGYASGQFNVQDALEETNKKLKLLSSEMERDALKSKIFGIENQTAGTIMLQNVDKYEKLNKAVTGTSVAYTQAAVNTDNQASALEQAKNKAELNAIALGEKLSPAMTVLAGWGAKLMQVLSGLVDWIDRNSGAIGFFIKAITLAAVSIGSYTAWTKLAAMWTARFGEAGMLAAMQTKLLTLAQNAAFAASQLWAAATMLLTGNINGAAQAMRVFNTITKASPVGLVIGIVTAVAGALILFSGKANIASKAIAEFWSNMAKQKNEMNNAFEALKTITKGTEEYKKAIEKINTTYGEYLPFLLSEKDSINDIALAQKLANIELERSIALKAKNKAASDITEEAIKDQSKNWDKIADMLSTDRGDTAAGMIVGDMMAQVEKLDLLMQKGIYKTADAEGFIANMLDRLKIKDEAGRMMMKKYLGDILETRKEMNDDINRSNMIMDGFIGNRNKFQGMSGAGLSGGLKGIKKSGNTGGGDGDGGGDSKVKQAVIDLEAARIDLMRAGREKELALERAALAKKLAEIKGNGEKEQMLRALLITKSNMNIADINAKWDKTEQDRAYSAEKEKMQLVMNAMMDGSIDQLQAQIKILQIERDHILENTELTEQERANIKEKFRQAEQKAQEDFDEKTRKRNIDTLNESWQQEKERQENELTGLDADILKSGGKDKKDKEKERLEKEKDYKLGQSKTPEEEALIEAQYLQDVADLENKYFQDKVSRYADMANKLSSIVGSFYDNELARIDQNKNAELAALEQRGLKGEALEIERTKIEKKYNKERAEMLKKQDTLKKVSSVASIIADTAMAIGSALATFWMTGGMPWVPIIAGLGAAQIAAVLSAPSPQAAKGKMPVRGKDDGKLYNASIGSGETGVYSEPTLLVGEGNIPEVVISGPTYKKMQVNAPEIMDSIRYFSSPQAASGLMPSGSSSSRREIELNNQMLANMYSVMAKLNDQLEKGIKAPIVYRDIKDMDDRVNEIERNINA